MLQLEELNSSMYPLPNNNNEKAIIMFWKDVIFRYNGQSRLLLFTGAISLPLWFPNGVS